MADKYNDFNIYMSIAPVYYISKIFGTAPYILHKNKTKTQWKVHKMGVIQSVIYLCILIASIYPCFLYQKKKILTQMSDVISIYSDIFKMTSNNVTAIIATAMALSNGKKTCGFINSLADFDKELKQLGIFIEYRKMYKKILVVTVFVNITILIIISGDFSLFTKFTNDILTNIYWVACTFFFIIICAAITQLSCFMYLIFERFKVMNNFIINLTDSDAEPQIVKPKIWIKVNPLKSKNHVADLHNMRHNLKLFKFITVLPPKINCINTLCSMHDKLCDLTMILNSMYSVIILVITGTAFVVLVTHLYFFYLMISGNTNYIFAYDKAWNSGIWGFIFFVIIFVISYACSKTKEEADNTGIFLHRINTDIKDEDTRNNVEMFSLQMLHQRVEFSACGFFPVDFTVIYMIIGAVTTYLVFLIQFEITGRSINHG